MYCGKTSDTRSQVCARTFTPSNLSTNELTTTRGCRSSELEHHQKGLKWLCRLPHFNMAPWREASCVLNMCRVLQ